MLAKDYLMLVLFAGLLVSPLVYFLMNRWLETFAYIVQISGWYYFFGILAALGSCLFNGLHPLVQCCQKQPFGCFEI